MLPSLARADEWTAAGIDVTLVDPQRHLYYSGMVPEYLGGVYEEDEMRIDLARMARAAGATYVQARARAIDPTDRTVETASEGAIPYDVLSVDVGSANPAVPTPAIATKPIARIRALAAQVQNTIDDPGAELRLIVVGGGAAGVEVALNVTGRFAGAGRRGDLDLTIIEQNDRLLPGFPEGMRTHVAGRLRRRGATVQTSTTVTAVEAAGDEERIVRTDTAPDATADAVLWATGTVGPPLLRDSPLPTDDRGFLHTTRSLQVEAHPRIFAAGDCAALDGLDLAKVGVHAVKQGPTLRSNLDRTLGALVDGRAVPRPTDLKTFRAYPLTPLILSTGTPDGLWTAGPLWAAHPWLLRLKHWVDRRWIRPYAPMQWADAGWRDVLGAESAAHPGGSG